MSELRQTFDRLIGESRQRFAKGDLPGALAVLADAERVARENNETVDADRALTRWCFVRVEMGEGREVLSTLQSVFMQSADLENRCNASYALAVAYDIDDDLESASRWAQRSFDLARSLDQPETGMTTSNLAGALHLRRSEFDEAAVALNRALEFSERLQGHDLDVAYHAQIVANIGYCAVCRGEVTLGVKKSEEAREALESVGAEHYLYENLQDLCYGYILDDQLDRAQECGQRAFDLAVAHDDSAIAKNCLFLLSEIAVRRGDTFRARRYLRELATYYPEVGVSDEIVDVFLSTDLTQVVNLRG